MILNNRYKIAKPLDSGQESKVTYAKDLVTNKDVVLKGHKYQGMGTGVEKEILQMVTNEHLPLLLDVFEEEGTPYIVINYIEGQTFADLINKETLEEYELVDYIWQLCDVVTYLHNHPSGIVHGDITPRNILVNTRGHLSLIDFGAGLIMDYASTTRAEYISAGTIGYTAPENMLYPEMSGWQSDVYGIGAILKQCLKENGHIFSLELKMIADKATALKPDDRYRNIQQMKEDLQLLL